MPSSWPWRVELFAWVLAGCVSDAPQVTPCVLGATECAGACVDLAFNAAHCGACGLTCAPGEVCRDGSCSCNGTVCGDECVALDSHPAHCGACGNACEPGRHCASGECVATCVSPLSSCGDRCVDTTTDRDHCGACDAPCAAGASCDEGTCACREGLTPCGDVCADTSRDADHCGACNSPCRVDELCSGSCVLACGSSPCAQGDIAWGRRLGAEGVVNVAGLAVEASGDSWVAGSFSGSLDLGDGLIATAAGTDLFVARFGPQGKPRWLRAFGAAGQTQAAGGIVIDDGEAVVVGSLDGSVAFDGEMLTAQGIDVLVLRLDGEGKVSATDHFGGANVQRGEAIAIAGDGLFIGGSFSGQLVHDVSLTSDGPGDVDGFLLALDANGGLVTASTVSDAATSAQAVVAVSTAGGRVVATATSDGPASWDGQTFGGGGGQDAAVASFDNGSLSWLAQLDGAGPDALTDVVALSLGALVVGDFTSSSTLSAAGCPPLDLTTLGGADGLVAALDESGCVDWHRQLGGAGADRISSVASSGAEAIVAGHFAQTLSSEGMPLLTTTLVDDGFVARLGAGGVVWATRLGATACPHWRCGVAVDPTLERALVAGTYDGTVTFGVPFASAAEDGFLAALAR